MPAWFRREIAVSNAEVSSGRLTDPQFREALLLLHTRGFVILRGAIPQPTAQRAQAEFDAILRDCQTSRDGESWYQVSREHQAVFWQRGSRWRIFPKLRGSFGSPCVT